MRSSDGLWYLEATDFRLATDCISQKVSIAYCYADHSDIGLGIPFTGHLGSPGQTAVTTTTNIGLQHPTFTKPGVYSISLVQRS